MKSHRFHDPIAPSTYMLSALFNLVTRDRIAASRNQLERKITPDNTALTEVYKTVPMLRPIV